MHKKLPSLGESLFALAARKLRIKLVASETLVCVLAVVSLPTLSIPITQLKFLEQDRVFSLFFFF